VRAAIDVLAGLPGPRWLVLGDMGEVGDQGPAFHAEVGAYARERGIETLWCAARPAPTRPRAYGRRAPLRRPSRSRPGAATPRRAAVASVLVKGSRFMADGARRRALRPRAAPGGAMLLSLASGCSRTSPSSSASCACSSTTFRAVMAAMTALLIGLAFGPWVIRRLTELKIGQPIREYGVQAHICQARHADDGRRAVLIGIGVGTLLWSDWSNRFVWIVMLVTFGFGAIGWVDDWRKVVQKNPEGMRSREKYFWQSLIGLVAALYLLQRVRRLRTCACCSSSCAGCRAASRTTCPEGRPDGAVLQDHQLPARRLRLHRLTYFVIVGASNAGQPDRRPRRPGDHAGGAGLGDAGHLRLRERQLGCNRSTLLFPYIPGAPGELLIFCAGDRAGGHWPSCGSTTIRRRSHRATWARSRWAGRWAPSRSSRGWRLLLGVMWWCLRDRGAFR
jgi:phospho-N-acetylmuramoyl-pentapeptide-transferase